MLLYVANKEEIANKKKGGFMKRKDSNLIFTLRDLRNFILETGMVPVPKYEEKGYVETIIPCRTIWEEKRRGKKLQKKRKPIEF